MSWYSDGDPFNEFDPPWCERCTRQDLTKDKCDKCCEMKEITFVLSREDYERFAEEHPEQTKNIEDVDFHGIKFRESVPTTENRAMRRAKK